MDRERLQHPLLPINRVAYRVVKKAAPEDVWRPTSKPDATRVSSPNFLGVVSASLKNPLAREVQEKVVGKRRGRLVVVGYAKQQSDNEKKARWVVKCDCGNYETRRRIFRWLNTQETDMCVECSNREYLLKRGELPPKEKAVRHLPL